MNPTLLIIHDNSFAAETINILRTNYECIETSLKSLEPHTILDDYDTILIFSSDGTETLSWLERSNLIGQDLSYNQIIVILENASGANIQEILETSSLSCYHSSIPNEFLLAYIDVAIAKTRRARFLNKFSTDINALSDIRQVAGLILDRLQDEDFVGYHKATLTIVGIDLKDLANDEKPNRVILDYRGYTQNEINQHLLRPIADDEFIYPIVQSGKPYIVKDLRNPPANWEKTEQTNDILSWMGIPLLYGQKLVGIITLDHRKSDYYGQVDEEIVERFAAICALAIEKVYQERNTRIIQETMSRLSVVHELDHLLNIIITPLMTELNSSRCTFFRRDETSDKILLTPWVWFPWGDMRLKFEENEGVAGKVLADGKSRIIADASRSPDYLATSNTANTAYSMLVVPVKVEDRTIAVISADRQDLNAFSNYDLDLVDLLARQAATIIERTWSLQLTHDISKLLNRPTINIDEILKNTLEFTNANSAIIYRLHYIQTENTGLEVVANYPADFIHPKPRLGEATSITSEILRDGSIKQFSADFKNQDMIHPELKSKYGIKSVLGTPLEFEDKIIGILFINAKNKTSYNSIELHAIKIFANQAAQALNNTGFVSRVTSQVNILTSLVQAIQSISRTEKIEQTYAEITQQACKLVGASFSQLAIVQEHGNKTLIEFVATAPGNHAQRMLHFIDLETGAESYSGKIGISGLAVKKCQAILVKDIELETNPKNNTDIARHYIAHIPETQSELAIPIQGYKGNIIGVINIEATNKYALNESHKELMLLFASQVAIAIQKDDLLNRLTNRTRALENLYQISNTIMLIQSTNIEQILRDAIATTCDTFKIRSIVLIPMETGQAVQAERIVTNEAQFKDDIYVRNDGISRKVFEGKSAKHVSDDIQIDTEINPKMKEVGIQAALCLPLKTSFRNIGVAWLHFAEKRSLSFAEDEIKIYQLYTNQFATAYDNAIKFQTANENLKLLQAQLKSESEEMTKGIGEDYKTARSQSFWYFVASFSLGIIGVLIIFLSIAIAIWINAIGTVGAIFGVMTQALGAFIFTRATAANIRMDNYHYELLQIRLLNILLTSSEKLEDKTLERDVKREVLSAVTARWFKEPQA